MTVYSHELCQWWKKLPKKWQGKKRKCPCCGRLIYSRMDFTKHGDPRTGPVDTGEEDYGE